MWRNIVMEIVTLMPLTYLMQCIQYLRDRQGISNKKFVKASKKDNHELRTTCSSTGDKYILHTKDQLWGKHFHVITKRYWAVDFPDKIHQWNPLVYRPSRPKSSVSPSFYNMWSFCRTGYRCTDLWILVTICQINMLNIIYLKHQTIRYHNSSCSILYWYFIFKWLYQEVSLIFHFVLHIQEHCPRHYYSVSFII